MAGYERLESVGGGGRYDALASDGRTTYPGVGISLRRLAARWSRCWPTACWSRQPRGAERRARRPRRRGVARRQRRGRRRALRAPRHPVRGRRRAPQKFGKQIRYAERRGIPYVWFPGADGGHEVKDIRSGEQVAADPAHLDPARARTCDRSVIANDRGDNQ